MGCDGWGSIKRGDSWTLPSRNGGRLKCVSRWALELIPTKPPSTNALLSLLPVYSLIISHKLDWKSILPSVHTSIIDLNIITMTLQSAAATRDQNTVLMEQLTAMEKENKSLSKTEKSLTKERDEAVDLNKRYKSQARDYEDKMESKVGDLKSKKAELESEVGALKSKKAELKSKIGALKSKKAELESKKAELESKNAELESKVGDLKSKRAGLESKRAGLESEKRKVEGCAEGGDGVVGQRRGRSGSSSRRRRRR